MPPSAEETAGPSRIVFGSCNSQHFEQPFWDVIAQRRPAAFVWAGDAVYADDRRLLDGDESEKDDGHDEHDVSSWHRRLFRRLLRLRPRRRRRHRDADPAYLNELYRAQRAVPGYRALLEAPHGVSVFGTLDDHDYGRNNGDRTFPWRAESGREFVRFLGLDGTTSAMARRAAAGEGVYGVHVYDFSNATATADGGSGSGFGFGRLLSDEEAGIDPDVAAGGDVAANEGRDGPGRWDRLVAVFVIDVRTHKTPWGSAWSPPRFSADPDGDFLGEAQWTWLETALGRSRAAVNVVVSGVQIHAPWFYDGNLVENWSGFPAAQQRLYRAVLQPNVRAPLLVSGDVHLAQLLRKDCRRHVTGPHVGGGGDDDSFGEGVSVTRPLYEITTSGMTHSWGSTKTSVCGRPADHWLCTFYPYNAFMGMVVDVAHRVNPWTALVVGGPDPPDHDGQEEEARRKRRNRKQLQYTLDRNVAELEFDWARDVVVVRILGDEGQVLLRQDWSMDELTGGPNESTTMLDPRAFRSERQRLLRTLHLNRSPSSTAAAGSGSEAGLGDGDFVCVNHRGNPGRMHVAMGILATGLVVLTSAASPFLLLLLLYALLARRVFCRNGSPGRERGRKSNSRHDATVGRRNSCGMAGWLVGWLADFPQFVP